MKKSKNVRMDEWMFDCLEELASQQNVESSALVRDVLTAYLAKRGLSRAVYYNRRVVRARQTAQGVADDIVQACQNARQGVQENLERRGE